MENWTMMVEDSGTAGRRYKRAESAAVMSLPPPLSPPSLLPADRLTHRPDFTNNRAFLRETKPLLSSYLVNRSC